MGGRSVESVVGLGFRSGSANKDTSLGYIVRLSIPTCIGIYGERINY